MTFIDDLCLHCRRPIDDDAVIWDPDSRLFICCCEVAPDEMRRPKIHPTEKDTR